jgi:hypothetical protein
VFVTLVREGLALSGVVEKDSIIALVDLTEGNDFVARDVTERREACVPVMVDL